MAKRQTVATERHEQRALVKWWRTQYPGRWRQLLKIGNEGKKHPIAGSLENLEGRVRGASDLLLAVPRNGFGGMFIEMKQSRKYSRSEMLTDTWIAQQQFLISMQQSGYHAVICYGWEMAMREIVAYLAAG